jgi:hypothetical protein
MGGKPKNLLLRKYPGEAVEVFAPVLTNGGTAELREPPESEVGSKQIEQPRAAMQPAETRGLSPTAQAVRRAMGLPLKPGAVRLPWHRILTTTDFVGRLHEKGFAVYSKAEKKYYCLTCGNAFSPGDLKKHFDDKLEIPKEDLEALAGDAEKARKTALYYRCSLEASGENGEEILVVGRCAKGFVYRAIRSLCAGRPIKVIPPLQKREQWELNRWACAWRAVDVVKRLLPGVQDSKADGGIRLSPPPLVNGE